jgi:hypothetical protein
VFAKWFLKCVANWGDLCQHGVQVSEQGAMGVQSEFLVLRVSVCADVMKSAVFDGGGR